jgi:hypothetical protein
LDVKLSMTHHFGVAGPQKGQLFVVLQLEGVLCSVKYNEDWSGEPKVLFLEDKSYDDRYFIIFDDYVGVIARTGLWSF